MNLKRGAVRLFFDGQSIDADFFARVIGGGGDEGVVFAFIGTGEANGGGGHAFAGDGDDDFVGFAGTSAFSTRVIPFRGGDDG